MMHKPGDLITYYKPGKAPRDAEVTETYGSTRIRIKMNEPDGNTRTVLVAAESCVPRVKDPTPHVFITSRSFRV